jgi:oligoendopeptidase F
MDMPMNDPFAPGRNLRPDDLRCRRRVETMGAIPRRISPRKHPDEPRSPCAYLANSRFPAFSRPTTRDAVAEAGGAPLGDLPDWDLTDLYAATDAPELVRDLDWLETECAAFAADYEGKLAESVRRRPADLHQRHEKIDMIAGRIMSFAGLRYYQQTTNPERAKFMSDMQDKITNMTTPLVFFSLEFNRIADDRYDALMAENEGLARYKPVLDRMRAMKPHQLSDELERFLHDTSVVGASAWNKLFDETIAGLSFDVDGESLGIEATLNLLTEQDRAKREAGARALAETFQRACRSFARVHNTLAKEKEIADRWRKLPTPQAWRHLANHVEPEVVEALRDAVVAAYPRLSHRYYALKAKWLGLDTLQVWDRNAPLPMEDTRSCPGTRRAHMVTEAYAGLRPEDGGAGRAVLHRWLDRRGREGGQGPRRLRASHGDGCAPLRDAELPRQTARCHDARP